VGIGLISYPLYLWHWPLLSFAAVAEGGPPAPAVRINAVLLSILLAFVTYKIIEKPIRYGDRNVVAVCAVLCVLMLAIGLIGLGARAGKPPTMTKATLVNAGEIVTENGNDVFFKYQLDHFYLCTPDYIQKRSLRLYWPARCLQSKPSEKKDVALIGDSHAEDLFIGLAERYTKANIVKYIQALPIRGIGFDDVLDYVVGDRNIRSVILTGYWDNLPTTFSLENELTKTVTEMLGSGKKVYLIDDRPDFSFRSEVCKYQRRMLFWQAQAKPRCDMERSQLNMQRDRYYPALMSVAGKFPAVKLIDTAETFCNKKLCHMASNHVLFFRDQNHLTIAGSRAVAEGMSDLNL
jgi:hypothetical protein